MTHVFFKEMEINYEIIVRTLLSKNICDTDIEWSDIVISIRGTCCISRCIAELCNKYQRFHIYLLDDNLFMHRRRDRFMKSRQREMQNCLNHTDLFLTSNSLLSEYICERSKIQRCAFIGTAINEKDIFTPPVADSLNVNSLKILYYSNDGTSTYFLTIMGPVLQQLQTKEHFNVIIEVIGMEHVDNDFLNCTIKYVPHLSLSDFREYLKAGHFDIGLAPLVEGDGFSQYKYFNKFLEYSMAGILGIYSNCPPNTFIVRDGINGFLCDNTEESWLNTLEMVAKNKNMRIACLQRAQEQLRKEFSIKAMSDLLISQIPELQTFHAPKVKIRGIWLIKNRYFFFRFFEKANSVMREFRKNSFKGVFQRSGLYIKTMKQNNSTFKANC